MAPPIKVASHVHDGLLDMMVNGTEWLGQLGELRAAVLAGEHDAARRLAARPIRFRPWREVLAPPAAALAKTVKEHR